MTSSIDSLTGMPMPALAAANATVQPNVSTGLPVAASAAAAASAGTDGAGSGFERLMRLQQRGRELEAKLTKDAAGAASGDPAATAASQQKQFYAKAFKELRELVGPTPGGNARRALAAVVERMEAGGELKPTDRARIRLAIAADEKRVDLAGANAYRHAIVELDRIGEATTAETKDPTIVQDPDRLADFQSRMRAIEDLGKQLLELTAASRLDPAAAHAIASKAGKVTPKQPAS